jgi:subtilisin family serine protease
MKKSLLFGRFVIAIVFVFYASMCFAQDDVRQGFNTLTQSSKIIESDLVLEDFMDGNETTPVIVKLIEPAVFQQAREFVSSSSDNSRSFKNLGFRDELRNTVQAAQEQAIGRLDPGKVQITNRFTYIFGFSAEVTIDGLKELEELEDVVSICKDSILQPHLAQGIPLMNASTVRSTYNGSGMSIAICDTGIDYTHARLGGGGFPNSKVIGGRDVGDDDTDPMDAQGHGTSCAGIAAGDLGTVGDYIGGVAHNARLYAVKISTGSTGNASTSNMIEGWEWCITHQNDDPSNPIMVISTSFGGDQYFSNCDGAVPLMTDAAANCVAAGMTLFVSSGNEGFTDSMGWPACISHVNSVGAVYDADVGGHFYSNCNDFTTAPDQVTCYSNSASFLTLFASSHDAYTTAVGGGYTPTFGGTSAACPYAAGSAACLQSAAKSINGSYLSPAEVKSSLTSTGDLVTDIKVPSITKPRINLQAAVDALGGSPSNVLWDQPVSSNTNVYACQDFEPANDSSDIFIADDFINTVAWTIETIFVPGDFFNGGTTLMDATNLHFQIYADDGGLPDGDPYGGGNSPVWSLSIPPADAQVTLSNGVGALPSDVTLDLDTPINLSPGTYWIVFYPEMDFTAGFGQYGRNVSDTTNVSTAQVINPGAGFGFPTVWTDITDPFTFTTVQSDLAFRLEGSAASFGDELALDFGPAGLWDYDGTNWALISGSSPEDMVGWSGGLAMDFGASGLWNYDGSTWTPISGSNVQDIADWASGLATDFGASGVWNYDGATWASITGSNPEDMAGWSGGLAMDFGASGVWSYDGSTWTPMSGSSPEGMVGLSGGLAMDFGTSGLWSYDGSTWNFITGSNVEDMANWSNGLAIDFAASGVWNYDGSTWSFISGSNPEDMLGWSSGLAMDFGASGVWSYDGSTWAFISGSNCEDMDDVDLY